MSNTNTSPGSQFDTSLDGDLRFRALVAVGSLGAVVLLVLCFWRLYKLTAFTRPEDTSSSCAGGAAPRPQDVLAALPVFVHVGAEDVECAVCLAELRDGEMGRLLPGCGHRFHVECVDRWLWANSTCPLCRAAAAGERCAGEAQKTDMSVPAIVVQG